MDETTARRLRAVGERLTRIEEQLEVLSARAGVPYERPSDEEVPTSVQVLAAVGKRIEAVAELRRLTGLSLGEATEIVDRL